MTKGFSNDVRDIIAMTRNIAERFGNNFIGVGHFLLCFNRFNQNSRLQICITFKDKRDILKHIKGKKYDEVTGDDYPLTLPMEEGLKTSGFHCWIAGKKTILPEHIYLGIVGSERENKQEYLSLLKNADVRLSKVKLLLINFYFNRFFRKIGILRILR